MTDPTLDRLIKLEKKEENLCVIGEELTREENKERKQLKSQLESKLAQAEAFEKLTVEDLASMIKWNTGWREDGIDFETTLKRFRSRILASQEKA